MAATLAPPIAHAAWRFWSYTWAVPAPGRYVLVVRATDGEGIVQTSIEQDPAPDGATGLHEISVTVASEIFTRCIFSDKADSAVP